jgi:hypothetical protein
MSDGEPLEKKAGNIANKRNCLKMRENYARLDDIFELASLPRWFHNHFTWRRLLLTWMVLLIASKGTNISTVSSLATKRANSLSKTPSSCHPTSQKSFLRVKKIPIPGQKIEEQFYNRF